MRVCGPGFQFPGPHSSIKRPGAVPADKFGQRLGVGSGLIAANDIFQKQQIP